MVYIFWKEFSIFGSGQGRAQKDLCFEFSLQFYFQLSSILNVSWIELESRST